MEFRKSFFIWNQIAQIFYVFYIPEGPIFKFENMAKGIMHFVSENNNSLIELSHFHTIHAFVYLIFLLCRQYIPVLVRDVTTLQQRSVQRVFR